MIHARAIVRELALQGVAVRLAGGAIQHKPRVLAPDVLATLEANKARIVAYLHAQAARLRLATAIREARRAGDSARAVALRDCFEDRAAIREYCGMQSRDEAERGAAADVLAAQAGRPMLAHSVRESLEAARSDGDDDANLAALRRAGRDGRGFLAPTRYGRDATFVERAARWRREAAAEREAAKS